MTGPDLDLDLETIGRRLSPRLGRAHDAVVSRAAAGAGRPRRLRPPWLGLHRLGGPAVTLAVATGFAAVLAVGVASPRGGSTPDGSPATTGPAMAFATASGVPSSTPALSTATATPLGATSVAPPVEATPPAQPPQTITPTGPRSGSSTPPPPAAGTRPPARGPERTVPPGDGPWGPTDPSQAAQPNPEPGPAGDGPSQGPRLQGSATAAPSPSPRPATIVLTAQDSGRTITVHTGDTVEVDLAAPGGGATWTEPYSTDGVVLQRTSGGTSKDGSAHAVFTATRTGTAQVQASRVPACANATPRCLPPQRIDFQVTVDVARGG